MTQSAPARLADLAFDVDIFFHGQACGRFGLDTSASGRLGFHIVISGTCWAHAAALAAPRRLQPGDALLFGRAVPHLISDARDHRDRRDPEAVVALGARAGLPATGLLCGYFDARNPATADWLRSFPECTIVEGGRSATRWPLEVARLMAAEVVASRDAASCLASRVAELFLVMSLREQCEAEAGASRRVRARRDPRLRAALDAIDADLARPWTVAELAAVSGVCRAKFSAWFTRELSCPPIAYLRSRRMRAAERLARTSGAGYVELAAAVGYRSVSAFRRHYREYCGEPSPRAATHLRKKGTTCD